MQKTHLILACAAAMVWGACSATVALAAPTTRPAVAEWAEIAPATQPAGAVGVAATQPAAALPGASTRPAAVATTQPADARAAAEERHKQLDPRWRQLNQSQRNAARTRWADAPIAQTFKPGALVSLSLDNGLLKVDVTDLATAVPVRVALEGSKATWMLSRRAAVVGAFGGAAAGGSYFSLTRYDFDAKEEEPWQSRLSINNSAVTLTAQNLYGVTSLIQANGVITLHVSEYAQLGQPAKMMCTAQANSFMQLRAEHPEDFRMYVIPLLERFADTSFLQPGAADVYGIFTEIPADQKVTADLAQLIPQLDADDPADRDAASAKLRQLGAPGVLAALRQDDSGLSEEQKLRLKSFVASFRRLPPAEPTSQRHNLSFLINCLEYEDVAVRAAAKAEIENQTHQTIGFDTSLTGPSAAKAADALRKQLLTIAPAASEPAAPATQPSPQV